MDNNSCYGFRRTQQAGRNRMTTPSEFTQVLTTRQPHTRFGGTEFAGQSGLSTVPKTECRIQYLQ